jgi:hypothetical protein
MAKARRTVAFGCATLLFAAAAAGAVLSSAPADAATPLAGASAVINRPPVDSLLSLCVTSHTLDPNGTCLTAGSSSPTSAGTSVMIVGNNGVWSTVSLTLDGVFQTAAGTYAGQLKGGGKFYCARGGCGNDPDLFAFSSPDHAAVAGCSWRGGFIPSAPNDNPPDNTLYYTTQQSTLTCNASFNGGPATPMILNILSSWSSIPDTYPGTFSGT